jgi:hypothetical protein
MKSQHPLAVPSISTDASSSLQILLLEVLHGKEGVAILVPIQWRPGDAKFTVNKLVASWSGSFIRNKKYDTCHEEFLKWFVPRSLNSDVTSLCHSHSFARSNLKLKKMR